jgi:hypothetical protein
MSNNYNLDLQNKITRVGTLIEKVNNLPEYTEGVELPELSNPASTSEIFEGKEAIDSEGNKVTGTFTIDSELTSQNDLLAQLEAALENKAAGGGGGDKTSFTYTWNGTEYKFYFLPGQTWEEWFPDTVYANKDQALIYFYGLVGITASIDWVQESDDYGYDVADCLNYPDTGDGVSPSDLIQPIDYGVSYWNA